MTKTLRKPVTMLLALCMVFTLAIGACADDITSSGGSATSPVNLTTTNDGITFLTATGRITATPSTAALKAAPAAIRPTSTPITPTRTATGFATAARKS